MSKSLETILAAKPDAVLIDLDDTLYAYAPAHEAGMDAVRGKCQARFGIDGKDFEADFAAARKDVKRPLGETAASHNRLLYFQRLIEMTTGKSDPMLSLDLEKTYWRRYLGKARLFPGAKDMIDELRYARIPTALVTDLTAQIQMRKLVYFELDQSFDAVVTSEEAGTEKPNPRIYRLALEKLGLTDAAGCVWMIGDDAKKDIQGAKDAVAAVAIQKLHHGVAAAPAADLQIKDFSVLAEAIRHHFS